MKNAVVAVEEEELWAENVNPYWHFCLFQYREKERAIGIGIGSTAALQSYSVKRKDSLCLVNVNVNNVKKINKIRTNALNFGVLGSGRYVIKRDVILMIKLYP